MFQDIELSRDVMAAYTAHGAAGLGGRGVGGGSSSGAVGGSMLTARTSDPEFHVQVWIAPLIACAALNLSFLAHLITIVMFLMLGFDDGLLAHTRIHRKHCNAFGVASGPRKVHIFLHGEIPRATLGVGARKGKVGKWSSFIFPQSSTAHLQLRLGLLYLYLLL